MTTHTQGQLLRQPFFNWVRAAAHKVVFLNQILIVIYLARLYASSKVKSGS